MKLNSLELRNFKGIKTLKIYPEGEDLNIYGENATGKTSVFDAFMWLLFDKDSSNSSNFNIKTLDQTGQVVSGLEHEVKATLVIEDRVLELAKIYKEKWTKKRGETEQTLTGHTTDYLIDGVPKRKKDYTELLENIIDEETFRILTNPLYFNTKLDWKKRREIAMDLVNDIELEDIFKADNKLVELKDLLVGDLTVEDLKAKTAATKRKLNEKVKQIPVRIDEISRQEIEIDGDIDWAEVEKEKLKLEKQIKSFEANTLDIEKIEELKEELAMLESWKRTFERDKTVALNEEYKHANKRLQQVNKLINDFKSEQQTAENKIEQLESKVAFKKDRLSELRREYIEIISLEFDIDENACKACGQDLPIENQEENLNKFEELKETRLKENMELGQKLKAEQDDLEDIIKDLKSEIIRVNEKEIDPLKKDLKEIEDCLEKVESQLGSIDFNKFEEYKENSLNIEKLNKEIESMLTVNKTKSQEQQNQLNKLEEELNSINILLTKKEVIETNLKRVEELKEEERELAEQIAGLEKTEMQCEEFIVVKGQLLEEKLNDKFELVKFKLFEEQVNGGIKDIFTTTVNGVPFEDLNNAMKINSGLDIINTLTKHYNFNPTIFIDNREGINEIIDIDSQIINLIVSDDKKLRVEDIYKPTEEDFQKLEKTLESIRSEFDDDTTDLSDILYGKDFEKDFDYIKEEYGYKSRWYIEKNEYYKYKGIEVVFSYHEPLTENQEGQGTNPGIQILKTKGVA